MQQRYYDPQMGRFLSVDPVVSNRQTGTNFARYWYANANPMKYVDPDGRYTCTSAEACQATAAGIAAMEAAKKNSPKAHRANAAINQALNFYGKPGQRNGVVMTSANLPGRTGAHTGTETGVAGEPKGLRTTVTLDVNQFSRDSKVTGLSVGTLIAGTLMHEGVHGVAQQESNGYISDSRSERNLEEISATMAEARFDQAAKINPYGLLNADGSVNMKAVGQSADRSVNSYCATNGCTP